MTTVPALVRSAALLLAGTVARTAPLPAQAVDVPFDSSRWSFDAPRAELVEHLGRRSLQLASGSAMLRDVRLQDGVIEVDVSAPSAGFAFIVFRAASAGDHEDIYLRMSASGSSDAVQYQPTFHRMGAWQLYHGPGYTARAEFDNKQWTHVRVEVEGRQARVFVGESATPVLIVSDLKRGVTAGAIGVLEGTAGTQVPGVYFSNFRYAVRAPTTAAASPASSAPLGVIRRWELSPAVASNRDYSGTLPSIARGERRDWFAAETEPTGLLNLARYRAGVGARSLVVARAVIRADRDEVRRLVFGYSDDVTVFLNGRPLFVGRNGFRARYASAAGLMTADDAVFLPLKRGENELLLAVAEEFGGWGLMARLGDPLPSAPGR